MPPPEREHSLQIEVARLRREIERETARAAAAEGANTQLAILLRRSDAETLKAQEALAAARRECEGLRAVAQAVIMFHGVRVWDDAASEEWHRLTGQPSTTKGLCDFARAALAAHGDGEEGKR